MTSYPGILPQLILSSLKMPSKILYMPEATFQRSHRAPPLYNLHFTHRHFSVDAFPRLLRQISSCGASEPVFIELVTPWNGSWELVRSRMPPTLTLSDIHSLKRNEALEILAQISRVEKKTFPTNEAFGFGEELWRKKPNTRVLYVTNATEETRSGLIAYAVYVRQKGVALLHKVCVVEASRRQGVGQQLMSYIQERLRKEGCQYIQLWVDKAREPARALYRRCGFDEREEIPDYYAPGRTGIRMTLDLERGG